MNGFYMAFLSKKEGVRIKMDDWLPGRYWYYCHKKGRILDPEGKKNLPLELLGRDNWCWYDKNEQKEFR